MQFSIGSLQLHEAFQEFASFRHSFKHKNMLFNKQQYLTSLFLIFVIEENKILIIYL